MVLSVDPTQRRISLSLKAAMPKEPEPEAAEEAQEEEAVPRPSRHTPHKHGPNYGSFASISTNSIRQGSLP